MNRRFLITLVLVLAAVGAGIAASCWLPRPTFNLDFGTPEQRFPRPGLPDDYVQPVTTYPAARAAAFEYIDTAVLVAALATASWLALKKRSRTGIFILMLFSLAYFGFYREGCICPIGAIQHVAAALANSNLAIPTVALLFFILPLAFALFFGRVFCSSVCPLGAMQDAVLVRPLRVPGGLEHGLGLLAYVYLGLAVLFAVTGAGYVICRYDPFVSFFRLTGSAQMFILGACFLLIAMFVGRPYCRYLCPLGVLLRLCSKVARRHATITPDECIHCRLCEDVCPFGAIQKPTESPAAQVRTEGKGRLALMVLAAPALIAIGAWLGHLAADTLAGAHLTVQQARTVRAEAARLTGPEEMLDLRTRAFLRTAKTPEQLYADETRLLGQYTVGASILGAWVGLVVAGKLIALSVRRRRIDYEVEPGQCVACGRCFLHCPCEHRSRKKMREATATGAGRSDQSSVISNQ